MATLPITKRGAEKLKAELHNLKTVQRPWVCAEFNVTISGAACIGGWDVYALLHGLGYTMREPVALVAKAKEEMISAIPGDVLDDWKGQLARARANVESAKTPPEKAFWADRARSLGVVVDKRGQCCVGQSSVDPEK